MVLVAVVSSTMQILLYIQWEKSRFIVTTCDTICDCHRTDTNRNPWCVLVAAIDFPVFTRSSTDNHEINRDSTKYTLNVC